MATSIHASRESRQAYWLFQFERTFSVDHVRRGNSQRWQARKEMQVGDGIVLWKSGEGAGVFGLGKVLSDPVNRTFLGRKPSVEWQCTRRSSRVFLREELRRNAQLRKLLAVRGVLHAGVERVSESQWLAFGQYLKRRIEPNKPSRRNTPTRGYWLFQANPRGGDDLRDFLSSAAPGSIIWWNVTKWRDPRGHLRVGDGVVMWQTRGTVPEAAGVYALGRIAKNPKIMNGAWQAGIRLEYIRPLNSPILPETLREHELLKELLVLRPHGFMGTNFPISVSQYGAVCALWQGNAAGSTSSFPEPVKPSVPGPVKAKGSDEHDMRFRERELVATYVEYAKRCGLRFELERDLILEDGSLPLKCDLYEKFKGILIEAKGNASRESVRMAIGELFDYRQFILPLPKLAVLLPERPADDLVRLLSGLDIQLVWQTADMAFHDSASGLLSQPS